MRTMDDKVNEAIIRLLDELCSWERNTGRCSTLLIIPHQKDEEIVMAQDGKPVPSHSVTPELLLKLARRAREEEDEDYVMLEKEEA